MSLAVVTLQTELQSDQLPAPSRARTFIAYVVLGARPVTLRLVAPVVPSEVVSRITS